MSGTSREEFDRRAGDDANWEAAKAAADLGKPDGSKPSELPNDTKVATPVEELFDEPTDPYAELGGGVPRRHEAVPAPKSVVSEPEEGSEDRIDLSGLTSSERAAFWAKHSEITRRVIKPVPPDTREAALADQEALFAPYRKK